MYSLVYSSDVTPIAERHLKSEIDWLVSFAKDFNRNNGITGLLMYDQGKFIQILEGNRRDIIPLYNRIAVAPLHTNVKLEYFERIEKRRFPDWDLELKMGPMMPKMMRQAMLGILDGLIEEGKDDDSA